MLRKTKVTLGAGAAALGLIGVVGGGVAFADNGSNPAPAPASAQHHPQAAHKHRQRAGMLARVEHGEFVLNGKQHRTVDVQRGQVVTVNANSITVKSNDGFQATYAVDGKTKVHKDRKQSAIDQVKPGDRVAVFATKNGTTDTANRINDLGPAQR